MKKVFSYLSLILALVLCFNNFSVFANLNEALQPRALPTYLEDGVYAIQNIYSEKYIDIAQDSPYTNAYMQQYTYSTSPAANSSSRFGLYKIERISGNDYVIRTMANNANTFTPVSLSTGSYVKTAAVPTSNASVTNSQKWTITLSSNGYIIRPKNSSTLALSVQNKDIGGGGATNPSSRLTLQARSDDYAKWTFTKLNSSITFNGVGVKSFTNTLLPGETFQYNAYMWSTTVGNNGPVSFGVTNMNYGATDLASVTSAGYFTAIKPGTLQLRYTFSGAGQNWFSAITIEEPLSGCFFVECFEQDGVWDVDSTSVGTVLECNETEDMENSLWWFEYQNNGYYAIRNDTVERYATNDDGELVLQDKSSSSFTNSQLWRLNKQSDGTYKITSKANSALYITEEDESHSSVDPDILTLSDDEGDLQKWHLKPLTYHLKVYYDSAYEDKYHRVMTALFGATDAGYSIEQTLLDTFGIHLEVEYTQTPYATYPDTHNCFFKDNPDFLCFDCKQASSGTDHVYECLAGYHHKNETLFMIPNTALETSNVVNLLLTGHPCCGVANGVHYNEGTLYGMSNSFRNSITVFAHKFDIEYYSTVYNGVIAEILLQSLNVIGGADNCTNPSCVVATRSEDVISELVICSDCQNCVDGNKLALYNHSA